MRKMKPPNQGARRRYWLTLLVLLALIVVVRWWVFGEGVILSTILVEALTFSALLLVQPQESYSDLLGLWEYRFSTEKVVVLREGVEWSLPWSRFPGYLVTDKHLFIATRNGGPITVPKGAFPSPQEFERLLELVRASIPHRY